jgi:hypothetical protein
LVPSVFSQAPLTVGIPSFYKLTKQGEYSITVNIWGYAKNPGRYEVPSDCDIVQLISYAGGPINHADLSSVKLYRMCMDSGIVQKQEITIIDLENISPSSIRPILLQHGDTIIIGSTNYPFWMDVLAVFRDISLIVYTVAVVSQVLK